MCQARFREREHVTDSRSEVAGIEQLAKPGETFGCDRDEKEHASDAVPRGLLLVRPGDRRHEHTSRLEYRERAVECLAADRIDDDIDILHPRLETGCLHVNDVVSTQGTDIRDIVCVRGGNHVGAFCKLDRIGPHIASGTMHAHTLRAVQVPVVKDHCHAVLATTGTEAASTSLSRIGLGAIMAASAMAYLA